MKRFQTKRQRLIAAIALGFLGIFLVIAITADSASEPSSPAATQPTTAISAAETAEPTPEPIAVFSVRELFAEREANAARFDLTHPGKKVLVSGVDCEIRNETLLLGDVDEGCVFLSDKIRLRDLPIEQLIVPSIGDQFAAVCTFGEYSGTVFMDDCVAADQSILAAYATATPLPALTSTATPVPAPTTLPPTSEPLLIATPTLEETLFDFVLCERLRVEVQIIWGQSPQVVYSYDPRVTGNLEEGDYIQILTPYPEEGLIRVKV